MLWRSPIDDDTVQQCRQVFDAVDNDVENLFLILRQGAAGSHTDGRTFGAKQLT